MEKEFDNPSSAQIRFAGDVNIEKVEMYSLASGAAFDIKNQVLAIQIYEDLFSPFITGSIIVKDSLDLINNLPFAGQEYVNLKVFTPTLDISSPEAGVIQGNFYVFKISDREYVAEKSVIYKIHFISTEAVVDLNMAQSRAFAGKISDIVGMLMKDQNFIGTEKDVTVETTKNETKFISNFWSPIKCINYLLQQATNPNGSTTYLFFENRSGFNFVSLDYLNEKDVHQSFSFGAATNDIKKHGGSTRVLDRDYSKIAEINVPNSFDYIDRVRHGTYASKLTVHDFTTKRYKTTHYDYLRKFLEGKEARLNNFPITTDTVAASINALGLVNETSNQLFTGYGVVDATRAIQDRISRMKQAESFKVTIKVKGRTDYTVGQVVYLDINTPSPTQTDDTPETMVDKMFSGNYLVAAINHYIDREMHECTMELIKDSLIFDLTTGKTA